MPFVRKVHGANQLPEHLSPHQTQPMTLIKRRVPKTAPDTSSPEKDNGEPSKAALKVPMSCPDCFPTEEWSQSDAIDKISKALIAFRKACENPGKDKQGYNYSYTTLVNVVETARPHLAKNELAVIQHPVNSGNNLGVVTTLLHASGQWLRCRFVMPIPALKGFNITQDAGACITYARRYGMSAMLGMVSDEDTDAT